MGTFKNVTIVIQKLKRSIDGFQEFKCSEIVLIQVSAKMIGGGLPLLPEILSQSGRVGAKFEQ